MQRKVTSFSMRIPGKEGEPDTVIRLWDFVSGGAARVEQVEQLKTGNAERPAQGIPRLCPTASAKLLNCPFAISRHCM